MSHNNYEHAARIFSNIPCDSWDNEVVIIEILVILLILHASAHSPSF